MFPPCPKYSEALDKVRASLSIPVHFEHTMLAIDKNNKEVLFRNNARDEEYTVKYGTVLDYLEH